MKYLHNSKGQHIANDVNNHLHSTNGKNIGHFLETYEIFIDMRGKYLGEIVNGNRLMYNKNSTYKNTNLGIYGNCGNVGNYGNPGNIGSIGSISGFEDVEPEKLE